MEEESLLLSLQTQRVIQAAFSKWLPPLEEQHCIWSLFKMSYVLIHCHSQQKSLRRCQRLSVVLVKPQCHYQFCTCMLNLVVAAHSQLMMRYVVYTMTFFSRIYYNMFQLSFLLGSIYISFCHFRLLKMMMMMMM